MTKFISGPSRARRDLIIAVSAFLLLFVLAGYFDVFESWVEWSRTYEQWELDEIPMAIALASVALVWFAWRRWQEQAREVHERARINDELGRQIAERERAQAAQRATETQFRTLIAKSTQGILIHRDNKPLFANQAMAEIFGYQCPEEIRSLSSVSDLVAEHEQKRLRSYGAARLTHGDAPASYEYEGVQKDGTSIWLENFVTVIDWEGARAVQTATVSIAERKKAEAALTQSYLTDLEIARDQAESANRAKSEFLATMSHELRTPLNAIIGFSEMIRDEMFGPEGVGRYRDYAKDIHYSAQHLLSIINDILDLSKVESGVNELHDDRIDVANLIGSVDRLVRNRARRNEIALEHDVPEVLPGLEADERKLKQILVNLLTNAIKFTEAGGAVTLKVWCRPDSGFVFQIIDTGIGIAPKDIPKALSQFGQVDSALNRKQAGTGLGLPLSKSLAELHGGSLDLQSQLGIGTTVTLRLPAARIIIQEAAPQLLRKEAGTRATG